MERKSKLTLLSAMLIFGTIGIFRKYIPLPSSVIALARGFIGTLFLLGVILCTKSKISGQAIKKNLRLLGVSGVFIGFNWILLFEAYRYTSVAVATLCYYMEPTFVILASPLIAKEKLTGKKIGCVIFSLVGMLLVSGVFQVGIQDIGELKGIFMGLAAALLYAAVIFLNKGIKDISAYDKTIVQLGAATLVLIPYTFFTEDMSTLIFTPRIILLLIIVGILNTGIAYALYFGSMKDLKAQTIALYSYIDPVVAILLSAVILKEKLGLTGIIGAVLILGAAVISDLPEKKTGVHKR